MNDQENSQLSSNTRYTKAIAYMAVFSIITSALVVWLVIGFVTDLTGDIEAAGAANVRQDTTIENHGYRLGSLEHEIVRSEKERDAMNSKLLALFEDFRGDMILVKEYVIEQKAREDERNRWSNE